MASPASSCLSPHHAMPFPKRSIALLLASLAGSSLTQQIAQDPGVGGVPIEIVHLYNDEYPQGQLLPLSLFSPFANITSRHRYLLHRPNVLQLRPLPRPKQHSLHSRRTQLQHNRSALPHRRNQFATRRRHKLQHHARQWRKLRKLPHRRPIRRH